MKNASPSSNNTLTSSFLDIFLLQIIVALKNNMSRIFMCSWSQFHAKIQIFCFYNSIISEQKSNNFDVGNKKKKDSLTDTNEELDNDDDGCLYGRDMSMVMERLGIQQSFELEELEKKWGFSELSCLFEDEPSLEEVKEAFDVFDQNKDGFIDEEELQRVLCALGLRQGLELQNCRRMIMGFDLNNDEKIDFNEFIGCMLKTF